MCLQRSVFVADKIDNLVMIIYPQLQDTDKIISNIKNWIQL